MKILSSRILGSVSIAAVIITGFFASPASPSSPANADGSAIFPGGIFTPHNSSAAQGAVTEQNNGDAAGAAVDQKLAAEPTAVWLGDWYSNSQLKTVVSQNVSEAKSDGTTPVFVTYAIPNRDCGGYSAGGLTPTTYAAWNQTLADAVRGTPAVVIVEPDALAELSNCPQDTSTREPLLYNSVKALAAAGATVYLDAGNSTWVTPKVMMGRLWNSGLQYARGFSSNVSNFYTTAQEQSYDQQLHSLSGKNYVIDVSRNAKGSDGNWCNPAGAGLGETPRTVSDGTGLDALLWIKAPGESDGNCNGAPNAGLWDQSAANALYANR